MAEPEKIIKSQNINKTAITGRNHHFLRSLRNPHKSFKTDIYGSFSALLDMMNLSRPGKDLCARK